MLMARKIKTAHRMPFMAVAGDHMANDMSGEDESSWTHPLDPTLSAGCGTQRPFNWPRWRFC
jgi:cobalamin biosynthesis Co2+ chelatase CbiK